MRRLCQFVLLLSSLPAGAATYTVTSPHLTMHAGDPLPPLIFNISAYSGSYASHFKGSPELSTAATSHSRPGSYPIVIKQGSMASVDGNELKFVDGVLDVIPADDIGARLTNGISYPPGFFSGPGDYALLNVTNNPTANLVGDCVTDNAANFAKLLSQNGKRIPTTRNGGGVPLNLYFPPGCYATSQPLTIYGSFWHLWGAGPQQSIIKLLPNSPAFNTGSPTQFFSPQSAGGNENFSEYLFNLGFEIGAGNPNAVPVTTVQNNSGVFRNVQIWADDSNCPYAMNFRRGFPGPAFFKNIAIYGCQNAISSNQSEYNATFEGLTTEGQTSTAINLQAFKMSIRHWLNDNPSTALAAAGSTTANVSVLDSKFVNGSSSTPGITVASGSSVYIKNLASAGYNPTESDSGSGSPVARNGNISQAWTGNPQSVFNSTQSPDSLHIPVNETPTPSDPPVNTWTKLGDDVTAWPAQIAGSRSTTVYSAPGVYTTSGTTNITVPDTVNHLQFFQSKFQNGKPQIILTIAGKSTTPLILDGCPYESCQVVHTSARPVVILDSTLTSYTSSIGAGDLYIEDDELNYLNTGFPTFYPSQHLWARQLDLEQSQNQKFLCQGCTLWMLGYKTEQASPSIVLTNKAQAEVFGFFFYQNRGPLQPISANIYLTDSSLFATGWTKVDVPGRGQPNWVIENQSGRSSTFATHDTITSQQLNVFYSYGGDTPTRAKLRAVGPPARNPNQK
ncbi:glycosyl hydrolase family 28-related protein [Tunturibacter empetritectus]|uniref:Rhamnogalacturonase A/B/Epimerase-like pectate lyase domain-containing protein n=1 Tax=Tunturiibacter lichenicola TaxID=2051959 RepID=A0A7W8J9S7_9BACT|nr:glycosyl hydrolase family 28-related protein [Edaphobacter lichenicola]MBB5345292.1 hypothetical protein [Edaphobacter lichenicola]